MLKIEGKTFMNIQEAVQWLLDNNALPFQCTADYAPLTEIGLGTIVNPSPAKVRIGSLIFFADSKVSTVVGITETGFICSDKYNNLVDDVAYVANVAINASGHLITTFSDGQTQDAGLIKQVSSFSINASQHLIATYNDGSTTDLGAIFSGNVNIAGNFTADSIIENMTGYSFDPAVPDNVTLNYAGVSKTGNEITFAISGSVKTTEITYPTSTINIGGFTIPQSIGEKLIPNLSGNRIGPRPLFLGTSYYQGMEQLSVLQKWSNTVVHAYISIKENLPAGTYYFRYEETFLLSENLAS